MKPFSGPRKRNADFSRQGRWSVMCLRAVIGASCRPKPAFRVIVASAILALLCFSTLLSTGASGEGAAPKTAQPFTDVTAESGVAAAIERHYQAHPNWWLSGLNL